MANQNNIMDAVDALIKAWNWNYQCVPETIQQALIELDKAVKATRKSKGQGLAVISADSIEGCDQCGVPVPNGSEFYPYEGAGTNADDTRVCWDCDRAIKLLEEPS